METDVDPDPARNDMKITEDIPNLRNPNNMLYLEDRTRLEYILETFDGHIEASVEPNAKFNKRLKI